MSPIGNGAPASNGGNGSSNSAADPYNPTRDGAVVQFDPLTGQAVDPPIVPGGYSVQGVAYSPDGRLLAVASWRDKASLWDAATQRRVGHEMVVKDDGTFGAVFMADGRRVAFANIGGAVRVYDVATQRIAVSPLPMGSVYGSGVAVSGDGRLATATMLGLVRLYDAKVAVPVGDQVLLADKPTTDRRKISQVLPLRVAFSPDGRRLATGGLDHVAVIIDLDPSAWRRAACLGAGRRLTADEWARYLPGRRYTPSC